MKTNLFTLLLALFLMSACSGSATQKSGDATPKHLNKTEFTTLVGDYTKITDTWKYLGDKPAIIDFYATWCGPCKEIAPLLEELAATYGDEIVVYKIDVDEEPELADAFGVRSIPTLLYIPMEGEPRVEVGMRTQEELERNVKQFLLNQ